MVLDEPNFSSILAEASSADVQAVVADDGVGVATDAAIVLVSALRTERHTSACIQRGVSRTWSHEPSKEGSGFI